MRPEIIVLALILRAGVSTADAHGLPDFTALVRSNAAGVVNISTTREEEPSAALPPNLDIPKLPEDNPLNDLLRRFFGDRQGEREPFRAESLGSGFIVSSDGYVITNRHVVEDADEIVVRLSDRRELLAKEVGHDTHSDIALLKIKADNLPVLKLGSSRALKQGEWVLAIGSPFGFDHSVTAGIVSAKGRSLPSENYVPFIQTDVAINPGNSGGPLFNLAGEVVGINSQIFSQTGGFMGLSFAIPIEVAMDVVQQLKTDGFVSRGWLGVYIQAVTRELAESFNMEIPTGALVTMLLPGSPALAGDLRVGDIILKFNGRKVPGSAALPPMVGRTSAGQRVELVILRNGKRITRRLRVGALPGEPSEVSIRTRTVAPDVSNLVLGFELRPLIKAGRRGQGTPGLRAVKVMDSPARDAACAGATGRG
ncbi:MAG: trypsin-like peptidase domain-containing protein [Gammaproteobacteria bacterium]|nr:trypsin-like peptidase domain-containing protein [Gammaproteobacteria bacterium]MBA3731650.1 trypsin-like peptidase domain-containing protein [Gammaproteobacteria bacterium]